MAAGVVLNSLHWLDQNNRIDLMAAVVMPDHIHYVAGLEKALLPSVMHSLKSFSANKINEVLHRRGQVWERQYHDRGIRNDTELSAAIQYCLNNPVKSGLVQQLCEYAHWYCRYTVD